MVIEKHIYPLSYSIPKKCIVPLNLSQKKKKFFSKMIPGKKETYIYKNENDYNKNYQESYFAFTYKKWGYDCLRHYEILANNCIPWFIDIDNIPTKTMTKFPKKIISDIISQTNTNTIVDLEKYDNYIKLLHNYTLNNLTCESSAQYLLNTIKKINNNNNSNNLNILMLTNNRMNYSMMSLAYGLRELLGCKFVDYPKLQCLYNKNQFNLHIVDNIKIDRSNIFDKIKNKSYDFIIIGACGRDEPKISNTDLVEKYYSKTEIVYIFGGDRPFNTKEQGKDNIFRNDLINYSKKGICFVRELDDNTNYFHNKDWMNYVDQTRLNHKINIKKVDSIISNYKTINDEVITNYKKLKRVLSFSLWGDIRLYCIGAIKNVLLAKYLFPGWVCRFYYDKSVPECIVTYLKNLDNTELILMKNQSSITKKNIYREQCFGSLWRFLVCIDKNVDQYIVCDADSRVNLYTKYYFDEMLKCDKFNFIRFIDLPSKYPICAGAFGGCKDAIDFNVNDFQKYSHGNFYCDQEFLKDNVYPQIKDSCISFPRVKHNNPELFNIKITGGFVGKVLTEKDGNINKYSKENEKFVENNSYLDLDELLDVYKEKLNVTLMI